MEFEKQKIWGNLIAADLFFSGIGGGCFFLSFLLEIQNKYGPISNLGEILTPIFISIALLCLLFHLRIPIRFYRVFLNPSSWMTRGSVILSIFFISSLLYSLPSFETFNWLPWSKASSLGRVILIIAIAFSLLNMIYPAVLLSVPKHIQSWEISILLPLFLFLSLYTGLAVLLLITISYVRILGDQTITILHMLGKIGIMLIIIEIFTLYIFTKTMLNGNQPAKESIFLLIKGELMPLFIGGVVIIGLIVPFFMFISSIFIVSMPPLLILAGVSGLLILMGGFLLRYVIVKAGVYSPIYIERSII